MQLEHHNDNYPPRRTADKLMELARKETKTAAGGRVEDEKRHAETQAPKPD